MSHPKPPADWDLAPEEHRRRWLEHAAGCTPCRVLWIAGDPSRVFAFLGDEPAGSEEAEEAALERVHEAVSRAIRPARPVRHLLRFAAAAVLAAALLFPATAWLFRERGGDPGGTVAEAIPLRPLADVEVLDTPGEAQVIDLSVGDTQVVMIFDPRFEI